MCVNGADLKDSPICPHPPPHIEIEKGVGDDGQGLPAGLVGSEELFRLHDRTARSFVQGCAVA
jgi:hypothetical protein